MDLSSTTGVPLTTLATRIATLISASGLAGVDISASRVNGEALTALLNTLVPANNGSASGLSLDGTSSLAGTSVADVLSALNVLQQSNAAALTALQGMFMGGVIFLDESPLVFIAASTLNYTPAAMASETAEIGLLMLQANTWASLTGRQAIADQNAAKAQGH